MHVASITDDCESCQNEISALTKSVNGCDFALGQGGDLHSPMANVNSRQFTLVVHAKVLHWQLARGLIITH